MLETKYIKNLPQLGHNQLEGSSIIKIFGSPIDFDDYVYITNKGYFKAEWSDNGYYEDPLRDSDLFETYYYAGEPFEFELTPLGQWLKDNGYLKDYSKLEEECKKDWEARLRLSEESDRKTFDRLKEQYGWS